LFDGVVIHFHTCFSRLFDSCAHYIITHTPPRPLHFPALIHTHIYLHTEDQALYFLCRAAVSLLFLPSPPPPSQAPSNCCNISTTSTSSHTHTNTTT
jgi:hypothetical protein